jgi:hypothetical protein
MTALTYRIPRDLRDPRHGRRRCVSVPGARIAPRECSIRLRTASTDRCRQFQDIAIAGFRTEVRTS